MPEAERLADHTTLRLGGPAGTWVRATTEAELVDAVTDADTSGLPLLVLGGGSNVVVADDGFPGTVVEVATREVMPDHDGTDPTCGGVLVRVAAGEDWDAFVGPRRRAGLGGRRGAGRHPRPGRRHPDPERRRLRAGRRPDHRHRAGLGPPAPRRAHLRGRRLRLRLPHLAVQGASPAATSSSTSPSSSAVGDLGAPVTYAELARTLGVEVGQRAPLADVREAVLGLRRGKGMVLDAADHDTWSAGSFFTNPLVPPADVPAGRAHLAGRRAGLVKTSAAWLIEHAGFGKGYGDGPVRLSSKHTLALTNRGEARTDDLLALAREVRDGVRPPTASTSCPSRCWWGAS